MNKNYIYIILLFLFYQIKLQAQEVDSLRLITNLEEISSDKYEGRATQTKGNALARTYLIEQFSAVDLPSFDSTYVSTFMFLNWLSKDKVEGKNIIGVIEGSQFPNQYIVLSGHYDHVGVRKNKIYNGADDNASGACALIELADYFVQNPPLHSIIIVAFDAEEMGLQGARCFVDEPPVPRDSIILNINMDMISRNKNNEIYICGTYHYPWLKAPLMPIGETSPLTVSFGHDLPNTGSNDWTSASDQGAFHAEQIPFLYFGVEDHKDYHKHTDDFVNIQPAFYYEATKLVLKTVIELDKHWEMIKP